MTYLFRVEAMNFGAVLQDTNDLSTIRGMGLVLLDSPPRDVPGFRLIYAAASVALYSFAVESPETARDLVSRFQKALEESPAYPNQGADIQNAEAEVRRHITFVYDYLPMAASEQFSAVHRALVARCRWKQMKTPTLVYPEDSNARQPCEVDGVRPAPVSEARPEQKERWISTFTGARRTLGLADKHIRDRFYVRVAGIPEQEAPEHLVNDLRQLSDYAAYGPELRHKIAVIQLDGNGFGGRTLSRQSEGDLSAWSTLLLDNMKGFLRRLVAVQDQAKESYMDENTTFERTPWRWSGWHYDNQARKHHKENAWRMEVLQWGGDEITLVVPAWAGWWTLGKFFEYNSKTPAQADGFRLTFGAGLVFCHHNAPIGRVRDLAAKLELRAKGIAGRDLVAYHVLESFDDLGFEPDKTVDSMLARSGLTAQDLVIEGRAMLDMLNAAKTLRGEIPRSKAYQVARLLLSGRLDDAGKLARKAAERAAHQTEGMARFSASLARFGLDERGQGRAGWLHLVELWDYLPEPTWKDPF